MTYYDELEVSPKASAEVIQGAYRSLVKRYHPDQNPGDAAAAERMKRINEAFAVLSDPEKRAAYDAELTENARQSSVDREEARCAARAEEERRQQEAAAWGEHDRRQRETAAAAERSAEEHARQSHGRNGRFFVPGLVLLVVGPSLAGLIAVVALSSSSSSPTPAPATEATRTAMATSRTTAPVVVTALTVAPDPAPHLSFDDEVTISIACGRFQERGAVAEYQRCKQHQLDIAASTPPVSLDGVPFDLTVTIGVACQRYQDAGDLAGHRACLRRKLAEIR